MRPALIVIAKAPVAGRVKTRLCPPCTPFEAAHLARAAPRERLLGLGLRDRRFGWPLEMVLRASTAGWSIREVGVSYHPRDGKSKVTGTVRGTVRAIRDMTDLLR